MPWTIVLLAAVAYPVGVLAGGAPSFPSRADCVQPAHADGNLEVVFGRFEKADDASALLERVLAVGFKGSKIEPDGCGLLKVDVQGITTLKVGEEVVAEAKSVHLDARVEEVGG